MTLENFFETTDLIRKSGYSNMMNISVKSLIEITGVYIILDMAANLEQKTIDVPLQEIYEAKDALERMQEYAINQNTSEYSEGLSQMGFSLVALGHACLDEPSLRQHATLFGCMGVAIAHNPESVVETVDADYSRVNLEPFSHVKRFLKDFGYGEETKTHSTSICACNDNSEIIEDLKTEKSTRSNPLSAVISGAVDGYVKAYFTGGMPTRF